MNKKTIMIVVSTILTLLITATLLFMVFLVIPYLDYINTHTWATVTARGEIASDADGEFELTQEYLQGDTITVGDVTVIITNIGSEGTVDLKVQSGNLYDSTGELVKKFTITPDQWADFTMDDGTVNFQVISNRYQ